MYGAISHCRRLNEKTKTPKVTMSKASINANITVKNRVDNPIMAARVASIVNFSFKVLIDYHPRGRERLT
jgi:hypothetical protein